MVGNGPYTMESPRSDEEIVLVRNDSWAGDFNGETWPSRPGRSSSACSPTSTRRTTPSRRARSTTPPFLRRAPRRRGRTGAPPSTPPCWPRTTTCSTSDPRIGGPENLLLRQAISMAVDRDAINEAVYNGMRTVSTGITPPGIRGSPRTCATTAPTTPTERRRRTTSGWLPATSRRRSRSSSTPMRVTSRWWRSSSTTWRRSASRPSPTRITETYFTELADGACVFCRIGWTADYPTYDNFMYDQYLLSRSTGTTTVRQRGVRRPDRRGQGDHGSRRPGAAVQPGRGHPPQPGRRVVPINWYLGDYAYNPEVLQGFGQNPLALIPWEQIT